jgi:hypothetical protein
MFECVMGLRDFAGTGCILADDMGLGRGLHLSTLRLNVSAFCGRGCI